MGNSREFPMSSWDKVVIALRKDGMKGYTVWSDRDGIGTIFDLSTCHKLQLSKHGEYSRCSSIIIIYS